LIANEAAMLVTKRKLASVGEILVEEFMQPLGLTQPALAEAMGVPRKHVNEFCNDAGQSPRRRR
jgi:antitoxin HigA-1